MEVDIIIILISIIFSAFFSGMEIAFVSVNKLHIELEKKREGLLPVILARLTKKSSKFITTMLIGNNISLVVFSYFTGKVFLEGLQIQNLLFQTGLSTVIILVTAEFLPKAIFRIYANQILKILAIPAYFFYVILYVFSFVINGISDFFLRVFFRTNALETQTEFSKEELGNYISEQLETGNHEDEVDSEIQIFQNALEFQKVKAREIMVPRTEIKAVEIHETVEGLTAVFVSTGYSKIMVYKNSLDDIIGYVNAFELFKNPRTVKSILLPVEIVPESMMISDLLNLLTKKRKSIAIVVDEYGGTSGMITVEDIVEELFGEIEDEHDVQELLEEQIDTSKYQLSARLEVDYLNETYDLKIPKEEAYETLGGFIIYHTENIPHQNEELTIANYQVKILKVSSSKIDHIYLKVLENKDN